MRSAVVGVVAGVSMWYGCNVLFNIGMKRSLKIEPDIVNLSTWHLSVGALFGVVTLAMVDKSVAWPDPKLMLLSAFLFWAGNVCTNATLGSLSVSFASVVKASEPLFSAALLWLWRGSAPTLMAALSLLCVVGGVLMTTKSASFDCGGLVVGGLANLFLQGRNIVNKELLAGKAGCKKLSAPALLGLSCCLALPFHVVIGTGSATACSLIVPRGQTEATSALEVACLLLHKAPKPAENHMLAANGTAANGTSNSTSASWSTQPLAAENGFLCLLATAVLFVSYQLFSILVLSSVPPVMHAILNCMKRGIVIGMGALLMHEALSPSFTVGASVALVGTLGYALSEVMKKKKLAAAKSKAA